MTSLTLVRASMVPAVSWTNRFGHVTVANAIGLLACLSVPAFAIFAIGELSQRALPALTWILISIALVIPCGLALWIARLLLGRIDAGLRASNWVARLTPDGCYLQYRSWLNWRLISGVHVVREVINVVPKATNRRRYRRYDAITLRNDVDLDDVQTALRSELHRLHSSPGFPASRTTWDDIPVFIGAPQQIWIRRTDGFLLRALANRVRLDSPEALTLDVGQDGANAIEPALLLVLLWRSEWNLAQMVAQFRLGMSDDESKAYLLTLLR